MPQSPRRRSGAQEIQRRRDDVRRLLAELDRGEIRGVWVSAGYPKPWIDEADRRAIRRRSSCWSCRTCSIRRCGDGPRINCLAASFAERAGSYVNFADRLQSFDWAIRPPAGVWVEGPLYWRLLGRKGIVQSAHSAERSRRRDYLFRGGGQ